MKNKIVLAVIVLASFLFSQADKSSAKENLRQRVSFQITTIAENAGKREILSQTTIEGLPGTDFNINLQTGNFKMRTRFLSDLIAPGKLKIRAALDTRRFYGYTPAKLPLYEEDAQTQAFEISFDEKVVLLPFGRNSEAAGETLKIEIIPSLTTVSANDESSPLKINFDKQIPSGEISIEAFKIPHRYIVEAALFENGREAAAGETEVLFEESKEIVLQPKPNDAEFSRQPFAANIKVDKFSRSYPKNMVGITFDLYRKNSSGKADSPIANNAAGINLLEENFVYRLADLGLRNDKNYEIRFKVKLADAEKAN